jgi:hypothetical protein
MAWVHLGIVGTPDPHVACERLGWPIRYERLGAATGGQQAASLPRLTGGFTLLIDPDLTPTETASQAETSLVRGFRLGHELAHTLFYSETAPPRRSIEPSPLEEEFCDAFAWAVLGLARPLQPA